MSRRPQPHHDRSARRCARCSHSFTLVFIKIACALFVSGFVFAEAIGAASTAGGDDAASAAFSSTISTAVEADGSLSEPTTLPTAGVINGGPNSAAANAMGGSADDGVLVLLDSQLTRQTHSIFFRALRDAGHRLVYRMSDDATIRLFLDTESAGNVDNAHHSDGSIPSSVGDSIPWIGDQRRRHGRRAFAAVILFAPTADSCAPHLIQFLNLCFGADLHASELVAFVEAGGHVIVAACATPSHLFGAQSNSSKPSHEGGCSNQTDGHLGSDSHGTIGNRVGISHGAHNQCTGSLVTDFALRCGIALETESRIGGNAACKTRAAESGSAPQESLPSATTSVGLVDLENTAFLSRLLEMSTRPRTSSSINGADDNGGSVNDVALGNDGMNIVYDGISLFVLYAQQRIVESVLASDSDTLLSDLIMPVLVARTSNASLHDEPTAPPPSPRILVSALQARNNARVIIAGSLAMFTDASVERNSSNADLCLILAQWALHRHGALAVSELSHSLVWPPSSASGTATDTSAGTGVGSDCATDAASSHAAHPVTSIRDWSDPSAYRIGDTVRVSLDMHLIQHLPSSAHVGKNTRVHFPFAAANVRLEVVMVDPFVRVPMLHCGNGTYTVNVQLPDRPGVYNMRVQYRQIGYTFIERRATIRVRPLSHTEHARFLLAAAPYYTAQVATVIMLLLFCAVFLSVDGRESVRPSETCHESFNQTHPPVSSAPQQHACASSSTSQSEASGVIASSR